MSSLLSIPSKRTYEVQLAPQIRSFIESQFPAQSESNPFEDDSQTMDEAIREFDKLRNKAVVAPGDKSDAGLQVLYRYYDQLCAIESKIPITPTQIPVSFKWKDAFDKGSLFFGKASLTLSYGSYEKACVMFNIAAMQSQIAAAQPLLTDEELKTAAKLCQQSAGMLSALVPVPDPKDSVLGLVPAEATPDLLPDTLQALVALMLAQAQDAIYLKANKDKMKPALLVKVANQAAEFYQEAIRQLGKDALKPLWEKDWLHVCTGKQLAFSALAHYHRSAECNQNKDIGEELARLTEAAALMQRARAYFAGDMYKSELSVIQRAFESAQKDNNFIYHERIPDIKSLPALPKATLAKALPPGAPLSQRFKDLFASLVPVAVSSALSAYESRKKEMVNLNVGRLREHTQLMNALLASLNLPAALDDVSNAQPLPESLRDKAAKVKAAGGFDDIRAKIDELPSLLKRNLEILDETTRLLTEEQNGDNQLRSQFKEKWSRMPSEQLTAPLWEELGKFKGIVETAKNADAVVVGKYKANVEAFKLLSKPEPELRAAMPQIDQSGGDVKNNPVVTELRQLLAQAENLRQQRDKMENELNDKQFDMTSEFLRALSSSGAAMTIDEESLSTQKLDELYGDIKSAVEESCSKQEELIAKITAANDRFVQSRRSAASGTSTRDELLRSLAAGHDAFMELQENLREGTKFYNDLTPLLVRLQQKVADFCFARKTEKEELMKELQQNIVSARTDTYGEQQTSTTSTTQPPARPPPPKLPGASTPNAPPQQQQPGAQQQQQQPAPTPYLLNYGNPYGSIPMHQNAPYPPSGAGQPGMPNPANPYGMAPQPYGNFYGTYPGAQQQPQPPYPVQGGMPYMGYMPPYPGQGQQAWPQQPPQQPQQPQQPPGQNNQ